MDEGNEFKNIEHLGVMTEELLGLSHLIQKSTSVAPRLFHDSAIEWVKVLNQLGSSAELDIVEWNGPHRDSEAKAWTLCMLHIWYTLAGALTI
ncbi:hypothetical protein FS749_004618, partial [Ceratobasidium sp. UAMH 11750]